MKALKFFTVYACVCARSCICRHTCECRYTYTYACMGRAEESSAVIPQTPFIYWPRTNQVGWIDWPVSPGGLPFSIPSPLTLKEHTTMPSFFLNLSLFKIFIHIFWSCFPSPNSSQIFPTSLLTEYHVLSVSFLYRFQGSNSHYYILMASTLLTKLFSLPHLCFLIS